MKQKYAFILAAGQGKRLRPYTETIPKPLVPVNGRPIIDYTIEKLKTAGITHITINLHYLGDRIKKYYKNTKEPKLTFSVEKEVLDTGGGVKHAIETIQEENFFLINGDALWTDGPDQTALERLSEMWNPQTMDILLLLQPVANMQLTKGIGDYDLLPNGQAIRSKGKNGKYMFAGVRISKTAIFEQIQEETFSYLQLMDKAQTEGKLYGLIHDGEWHHISTPEDLEQVNHAIANTPYRAKAV